MGRTSGFGQVHCVGAGVWVWGGESVPGDVLDAGASEPLGVLLAGASDSMLDSVLGVGAGVLGAGSSSGARLWVEVLPSDSGAGAVEAAACGIS